MRNKHFSAVYFLLLVSLVTFFLLAPVQASAQSKPIILKYSDPSKEGTARTDATKETMLEIEKRTGGRVKHEFYWSESLVKAKDSLEAIKAGTCDLGGAPDVVYHPGPFPHLAVFPAHVSGRSGFDRGDEGLE